MDVLPRNMSFNSQYYCSLLDRLKGAIRDQRRRRCHDFHYHQDNARPHKSNESITKLQELGFTILPHPAYSPDIAPSDYYLFAPMKSALAGRNFENAEEIQNCITNWLNTKQQAFFSKAFQELPNRWQKVIDCNGDYFV